MKLFTIFVFSLLYINCFSQQYSKSWKDLNYAGDTMIYHRLDIYLPEVEKPTYPAVILIYGSAWFGNNLKGTELATLGKALLDAGFAVVTPNHRSSMDAKFPAQINVIKAVIRFIRANAEKYQIDTSFIGIPAFFITFAVLLVDIISTPSFESPLENSDIPLLSETLIRALFTFITLSLNAYERAS